MQHNKSTVPKPDHIEKQEIVLKERKGPLGSDATITTHLAKGPGQDNRLWG